jgi:hypothetical protein
MTKTKHTANGAGGKARNIDPATAATLADVARGLRSLPPDMVPFLRNSDGERASLRYELAKVFEAMPPDMIADIVRDAIMQHARPAFPRGLLTAIDRSVRWLVGADTRPEFEAMAERVAAVGRGVMLRSATKDASPDIRELAMRIGGYEVPEGGIPSDELERMVSLVRTWYLRLGPNFNDDAIRVALQNPDRNSRITGVALALGILKGDPSKAADLVRKRKI